ncbi:MAG: hypothetical protein NT099_00875 [Candidatus Saganbacteria bacterium]|nr:hypothetical protein [Candidatus Saganbacteria bacterium]
MDKKSIVSLIVIFLVLVLGAWLLFGGEETAAPTVFTFDSPLTMSGWGVEGSGSAEVAGGSLIVRNKGEAYLVTPPFYLNTEEHPILKIIAEVNPPLMPLQIFCMPQNQNQFDFSQNFDLDPGITARLKSYYFNFKNMPRQPLGVSRILFKLPVGTEQFRVKEISFLKENNRTNLISAWQGFWMIPPVTVRTVNRINAPLWGRVSLMVVFYWLITASFLLALAFYAFRTNFKKFNLEPYLLKVMLAVIIALLVSWVLYDTRFIFDYSRTMYRQVGSFAFRSADYKRDVVFGRQITAFANYCKFQIPYRAKYVPKLQDEYQRMVIANSLIPFYCVDKEDKAEYVIGFGVPLENVKGFVPYRSFNNNQGWILKKGN